VASWGVKSSFSRLGALPIYLPFNVPAKKRCDVHFRSVQIYSNNVAFRNDTLREKIMQFCLRDVAEGQLFCDTNYHSRYVTYVFQEYSLIGIKVRSALQDLAGLTN